MLRGSRAHEVGREIRRKVEVLSPSRLLAHALVQLNVRSNRTFALPILLYSPTSRCNSRCVSCDYWKSSGEGDLSQDEVGALCRELPGLRTKLVVFTGGEPLVREDVFQLADLFLAQGVVLHLLTSGLALERHAAAVAERFAAVTVSLDGHTPELYRRVRGVDGLEALERGVRRLKQIRPELPIRARSTLHRQNFRALPDLIDKAESMGLDQVSFLTADVDSEAFGRRPSTGMDTKDSGIQPLGLKQAPGPHPLLLDPAEVEEFDRVIEKALASRTEAFRRGHVAERGDRLRKLGRYYRAHQTGGAFPKVYCNAPWVSAVIESDGTVRPCFFQPRVGSVRQKTLRALLDDEMVGFRRGLDVACDATCQRCVCSIRVGLKSRLW